MASAGLHEASDEIIREGLIVTLGHNMFSLPKLHWFSLRTTGLFYSTDRTSRTKTSQFENVIEFDTMFVRVEKIDEMNSKFSCGDDKVPVYCLRVGDKRKCRTLCFLSWEERDFWVISILHAIAQFKMANETIDRKLFAGKIRSSSSMSLRRSRSKNKHSPTLRHTRSECDRETRSGKQHGAGIRKRFSSLRSRKSFRDSREGGSTGILSAEKARCLSRSDMLEGTPHTSRFYKSLRQSFTYQIEETDSSIFCEEGSEENTPSGLPSPRYKPWFEKLRHRLVSG